MSREKGMRSFFRCQATEFYLAYCTCLPCTSMRLDTTFALRKALTIYLVGALPVYQIN